MVKNSNNSLLNACVQLVDIEKAKLLCTLFAQSILHLVIMVKADLHRNNKGDKIDGWPQYTCRYQMELLITLHR